MNRGVQYQWALNQFKSNNDIYQFPTNPTIGDVISCADNEGRFVWSSLGSLVVSSIIGTANEILANGTSGIKELGDITLTLPNVLIAPGTFTATTSTSSPIYYLTGSSTGTISILPQAAAGTYNFNLPTTAGTSGYFLTSGGGIGAPMTWTNPSSFSVTTLSGTTNEVFVNGGLGPLSGAITLSLPQTIDTGSSPTWMGLTLSGLTSGSVLFAGTSGVISQDNSNLYWDNTNKRLGIGTSSPAAATLTTISIPSSTSYSRGEYFTGTLTSTASYINITDQVGIISDVALKCPASTTMTFGVTNMIYPHADISNASAIIQNVVGLYVHPGLSSSAGSGSSVTTAYGVYINNPSFGTNTIALYTDNLSVGYTGVTPPINGLIVQGPALFGVSSATGSATINSLGVEVAPQSLNTTADFGFGAGQAASLLNAGVFAGSATGNVAAFMAYPGIYATMGNTVANGVCYYARTYTGGNVGTITNLIGFYFDGNTSTAGTITNSYGGYFTNPSVGTNTCALYSDNLSVGYTGTTVANNNAIISGNVGIGTSSATNILTIGTINTALGEAIKVNGNNSQNYMSFYNNVTRQGYLGTNGGGSGIVLDSDTAGGLTLQASGSNAITFYTNATAAMIINGTQQVAIGTSSPAAATLTTINIPLSTSYSQGEYFTGTLTSTAPYISTTDQVGIRSDVVLKCPASTTMNFGVTNMISPIANIVNSSAIIQNVVGLYVHPGLSSSAGSGSSVTNAYGGYFNDPSFGTNRCALYTDNLAINAAGTVPPTGGAVIGGNTIPSTDDTYSLGISSNRWLKLWVQDIDFDGTMTGSIPTPAGNNTNSTLTCFLVYLSTAPTNVTGDSTVYTILFDTTVFDQATNYTAASGKFTAPKTGKYFFHTKIRINAAGILAANTGSNIRYLVNGSTNYFVNMVNPFYAAGPDIIHTGSMLLSLSSGDYLQIQVQVSGGAKVIGLTADDCYFGGYFVC